LNDETLNRLQRVSLILEKGHYAHQSIKLIYIIILLLSIIAILIIIELVFFNRRVRFEEKIILICLIFAYFLASNE
jgi:hypothetical protein